MKEILLIDLTSTTGSIENNQCFQKTKTDENNERFMRNKSRQIHLKRQRTTDRIDDEVSSMEKSKRCQKIHKHATIPIIDLTFEGILSSRYDPCDLKEPENKGDDDIENNDVDCIYDIKEDEGNSMIVTYGLHKYFSTLKSTDTLFISARKNNDQYVGSTIPEIIHFQQQDKWSCGYRNLQMLLSILLPLLPIHHPYFEAHNHYNMNKYYENSKSEKNITCDTNNITVRDKYPKKVKTIVIPSIHQIQEGMQKSWKQHFDPEGAKHYNYNIYQTKKKIGAVEVASLMTFWNIDSTVIQFANTAESRSCLKTFLWNYFSSYHSNLLSHHENSKCVHHHHPSSHTVHMNNMNHVTFNNIDDVNSSYKRALKNITMMRHPYTMEQKSAINCFHEPLLPLYLQWEGHSVTIIGMEQMTKCPSSKARKKMKSPPIFDFNLIVLDPLTSISQQNSWIMKKSTFNHLKQEKYDRTHLDTLLPYFKLSTKKLMNKDCQIILPSIQPLHESNRLKYRQNAQIITILDEWNHV